MEQDLHLPPSRFLPAQLLQQKLLRYQENEGNKPVKKGNKASATSKSNSLLLSGKISSLESTVNEFENQDCEKDDDDDVAIPGKRLTFYFSCMNEMFT